MENTAFDLVIRNAHIATATDIFDADIGIRDGRIIALAQQLPAGKEEIDAAGRWVLPGGVDAHCHLAQPTDDGSVFADDFFTGTRSAACGGTTTVMPFALQKKGVKAVLTTLGADGSILLTEAGESESQREKEPMSQ